MRSFHLQAFQLVSIWPSMSSSLSVARRLRTRRRTTSNTSAECDPAPSTYQRDHRQDGNQLGAYQLLDECYWEVCDNVPFQPHGLGTTTLAPDHFSSGGRAPDISDDIDRPAAGVLDRRALDDGPSLTIVE